MDGTQDRPGPDEEFHTTFLTYATPMIAGEIKRHFRDTTWDVLGRDPTVTELAHRLDAGVDEVVDAMDAAAVYNTTSLDVAVGMADGDGSTLGDLFGADDPAYDLIVDRESLKPLLAGLDGRDKRILLLRYFRNLPQTEIGEEIGVSQMQVSRLLARILGELRSGLGVRPGRADAERGKDE
ncbi:sigma-70 family RNA polymerase sigma factor [Catenulispora sp. NF23]|uniref:sigma-70 family RNA polymerase sigma factor n=1 Tax=Catenulispora pinistramenti TaxID=2705254 RepID=UPI001BA8095B|nr:sigma-70 family RNA polymerase sigma factor [Catenulispora pinistramenti]MBS2539342.1 sigma-70 family RNA polymerase sigma factor [Catenulispora pinistramenti]